MHPPKQRSIITPEHFTVAPGILGLPLAAPSRRALAMAIDGILVLILVKAGAVFLGIAAATLLFRASKPDARTGPLKRPGRTALRIVGAILMFVVILNAWGSLRKRFERRAAEAPPAQWGRVSVVRDDADANEIAATDAATNSVAATSDLPEAAPLMREYLAAIERNDSSAADAYRDSVKLAVAASDISRLESSNRRLNARGDSLERELDEAHEAKGLRLFLAGFADDLGVGFGWSAVYFTAFLALWRGQTPGKRIADVRVLRLDGKPLGWWMSFERFGGYAASFSVGLIGFFQILWDRNRQGLHDKACETVVVRDSAAARARA